MLAHYAVRRLIHEAADKAGRIQAEYPSCTPSVSCAAGSSIQATFPPEDRPTGVIDEILEERVVSGRGQVKPRGVRQKMSGFPPFASTDRCRARNTAGHPKSSRIVPKATAL